MSCSRGKYPGGVRVVPKVVLLGGQGIWYARPMAHDLPSGMSDPTSRKAEETKVALRRKLKSKLGVEEDRWASVEQCYI